MAKFITRTSGWFPGALETGASLNRVYAHRRGGIARWKRFEEVRAKFSRVDARQRSSQYLMIYTAKLEQEGRTILLASVDGENYFSINWDPCPEDENDIRELLTPKSEGDPPYLGFKKDYLRSYDATFDTLGS